MPKSNFWNRLAEAEKRTNVAVMDKLEEGWFTVPEYAENRVVGLTTARQRINRMVKDGLLESQLFRVRREHTVKEIRAYRLKESS